MRTKADTLEATNQDEVATTARRRIEQLRKAARHYGEHHITIVQYFYSRYHAATTVALGAGILVALTLLMISKVGWDKANPFLINVFLVTAGVSAFFSAFPAVFEVQRNISENSRLYVEYSRLENRIREYLATIDDTNADVASAREAVRLFTDNLNGLNSINVGIDYTKIPQDVRQPGE